MNGPKGLLLRRYRISGLVGRGAQGSVLLVEDSTGARFAAKVSANDPLSQERLRRESSALSRISSPHVVQLVEAGLDEAQGWALVLRLVPGVTLSRVKTGLPFWSPVRVESLTTQVADGLHAIHEAGLVMRDLSPSQVIVHLLDGQLSACLVDLGLARQADVPSDLTDPRYLPGTPGFTAPEWALRGVGGLPADTYSLAALVWWVMSGNNPFGKASPEITWALQLSGTVTRPDFGGYAHELSMLDEIARLLELALSPEPEVRPASPRVFADTLARLLLQRRCKCGPLKND